MTEKQELQSKMLAISLVQQEKMEERIKKLTQELSEAIESSKEYISPPKTKNLSDYDLESFRVYSYFSFKSWFRKKRVIVYYENKTFSIEVIHQTWFNTKVQHFDNLSFIDYLTLLKELL